MMSNQGKSYDNIAVGFASMRDSLNIEQKYLDALINYEVIVWILHLLNDC